MADIMIEGKYPSDYADSVGGRVRAQEQGVGSPIEQDTLIFIQGSNIGITVNEDVGNKEVEVTIGLSGVPSHSHSQYVFKTRFDTDNVGSASNFSLSHSGFVSQPQGWVLVMGGVVITSPREYGKIGVGAGRPSSSNGGCICADKEGGNVADYFYRQDAHIMLQDRNSTKGSYWRYSSGSASSTTFSVSNESGGAVTASDIKVAGLFFGQ